VCLKNQPQLRQEKKELLLFALLVVSSAAKAQYNEAMRSGRSGHTIGPFTVGKGMLQKPSGIQSRELQLNGAKLAQQSGESVCRMGGPNS